MEKQHRIVALVDMDCFYAQVEQKLQPNLWGKPVAVVQYSSYKGGGILAVSYEARKYGIKRGRMFGDEAKELCPELTLCYVPTCEHSDKADLSRYRNASDEVFRVLNDFDSRIVVERASIDEAFLDLSDLVEFVIESETPSHRYASSLDHFPTTHIANGKDVNNDKDPSWHYDRVRNLCQWMAKACIEEGEKLRLAVGAEIVEQIRQKIQEETQFHCSAGIATNKMLAKLVCSRHKPKQQTIISSEAVPTILQLTSISSVRNLGGKLGRALMECFAVKTMAELSSIPLDALKMRFNAQAEWIYKLAQGIDDEVVKPRDKQTSIAVSKNFPIPLVSISDIQNWLDGLSKEIVKRLIEDQLKNSRTAQIMHVGCIFESQKSVRSFNINSYNSSSIYKTSWSCIRDFNKAKSLDIWDPPISNISLTAVRFRNGVDSSSKQITDWMLSKTERLLATVEDSYPVIEDDFLERHYINEGTAEVAGPSFKVDEFLPKSLEEIPKDVLDNMPGDIKKELAHYCKSSGPDDSGPSGVKPKIATRKEQVGKKRKKTATEREVASKKISQYFQKIN